MLIQYILNHLKKSNVEESVQSSVVDLLSKIKDNDALLSEFNSMDSHTLTSQLTVDHEEVDPSDSNLPPSNPDAPTVFFQDMNLEYDRPMMASGLDSTDPNTLDAIRAPQIPIPQDTMPFEQGASPDTPTLSMEELMLNPILSSTGQIGRYVDLGVLGEGGMGEVRKVRDDILNRNLAMKIVHPSMLLNSKALARFFEEAQIGAQLQHPNIIPIHEFGELPDGRLYFTMKEIKGTEFSQCIREVHEASTDDTWLEGKNGYTFRQLIQIFHKVCETVAYAHSVGVIHRDLKPENIMIGDFGEVLVVDWGIAKVLDKDSPDEDPASVQINRPEDSPLKTRMGMVSGTPTYMSPEQAEGRVDLIGTATDIYSLGSILYEILSGRIPYTGTSAKEIIKKVILSRPPSLNTTDSRTSPLKRPDVDFLIEDTGKLPQPLIEICEQAMERDIADRYPTASDFAQDIFNWLEGAQKRDKAFKEYSVALDIHQEAEQLELAYAKKWAQANELIEANGSISDAGWELWEQANIFEQNGKNCRDDYRTTLQGALVYDPELIEANEALAQILIKDIVHAVAHGAVKQRHSTERILQKYVQHLTRRKQQSLMETLEQQCNDDIVLMKARRGEFIGRQQMRIDIVDTLRSTSRLVSLVGTAGVGKSRLALEAICDLQTADLVTYFCNLTEATSELGIARSVAKAIGVQLNDADPVAQLGAIFAKQHTILVLDNLEQVIDPIRHVITKWMTQSDTLRIIATSRIQLRLPKEVSFPIQPLTRLESMEVFVKRGQLSKPNFTLHSENCRALERLVQRLDNLPLAIELAAARLNLFTIEEIEQRLEERFSLLRSRNDKTPALQGALDWSWDLLKPWAKNALSQASVFRGGFELNAAEAILDCSEWKDSPPIFDILQDLCDDSLLQQHRLENGAIRYKLLESVRQYAAVQLHNTIASMQTRRRHVEHYAQFGETDFLEKLDDLQQTEWGQFGEELDNFIIAIEYATDTLASKCCFAASTILRMKGPASLGVEITSRVLQTDHISSNDRKRILITQSHFLRIGGRIQEARKYSLDVLSPPTSDQSNPDTISIAKESNPQDNSDFDPLLKADIYVEQGNIEENESLFPKALAKYEQALTIYERLEKPKRIATVLLKTGGVHRSMGDYDQALHAFTGALEISTNHHLALLKADTLTEIGKIHVRNGEYRSAIEHFEPSLEIALTFDDLFRQERNLGSMGVALSSLGEYDRAIELDLKAIAINRKVGNRRNESTMIGNVGNLYSALGQYDKALSNIELALQISREIGNKYLESMHLGNLAIIFDSRGDFPAAIEKYKESLAVCEEIGDMPQKGLTLGNLGEAHIRIKEWDEAVQYLAMSIDICKDTFPTAAGAFSGSLAWICAKQGNLTKALEHIQYGEPLVAVYPFEHAKFLCRKAQILHWSNQPILAREALEQAETIKEGLHTENAELTQLLAESVQVLSTQQ